MDYWACTRVLSDLGEKTAVLFPVCSIYIDDILILGTPTPPEGFHDHYNITGPNIWGSAHNAPFDQPVSMLLGYDVNSMTGAEKPTQTTKE